MIHEFLLEFVAFEFTTMSLLPIIFKTFFSGKFYGLQKNA